MECTTLNRDLNGEIGRLKDLLLKKDAEILRLSEMGSKVGI